MSEINVVEKIKTHNLRSVTVLRKLYCLWDNVDKFLRAREDAENVTPPRGSA